MNEVLPRRDLDIFTTSRMFPEGDWVLSEVGRPHQFQAAYCVPNQRGHLVPAPMPPVNISAVTNEEEIYNHCTVYQFAPGELHHHHHSGTMTDIHQHIKAEVTQHSTALPTQPATNRNRISVAGWRQPTATTSSCGPIPNLPISIASTQKRRILSFTRVTPVSSRVLPLTHPLRPPTCMHLVETKKRICRPRRCMARISSAFRKKASSANFKRTLR